METDAYDHIHPNLIWRALSDRTRRSILDQLAESPKTTGDLSAAIPALSRFAVMKHLRVLEQSGLVLVRRSGRVRWNYLNAAPLREVYERWVSNLDDRWASSLLNLDKLATSKNHQGAIFMTGKTTPTDFPISSIAIEQQHHIAAPRDVVFNVLTTRMGEWWIHPFRLHDGNARIVVDVRPGGAITEQWDEDSFATWGMITAHERDLTLEWIGSNGMPGAVQGIVRFGLEDANGGTRLNLSHRVLGEIDDSTFESYNSGWPQLIDNLRKLLAASDE